MECWNPPPGWRCSREQGHDGPCAASPIENPPWEGFVSEGHIYPNWTDDQRAAIAVQCDAFADEFYGRNRKPDQEELDSLLRTLYDLVHVL